ncbi:MAG: type II toxin-antitoxin system RelE/ParE family toxin [Candidatus Aenigmarchaeota archaeon]|nr:type II toxin-antitoxin system RelE/ParE family toxin [Candidatus Aenigmarchaeota archaeon]
MNNYQVNYTKIFLKLLKKINNNVKSRILDAIESILIEPYYGSQLVFSKEKCRKWRVGNYRIIYKIEENNHIVILLIVAHRKKVYSRYDF